MTKLQDILNLAPGYTRVTLVDYNSKEIITDNFLFDITDQDGYWDGLAESQVRRLQTVTENGGLILHVVPN